MVFNDEIVKTFGKRLRTRVNGILIEKDRILMVRHRSLGKAGFLWNVPGGGMDYGQSASEALKREFEEEVGLKVKVCDFLFVHELLVKPLHAVELFFVVEKIEGRLIKGLDPEMKEGEQIIEDVRFMDWEEIHNLAPNNKHNIFNKCNSLPDLINKRGYFIFEK
jgi:8-oxo-dGTP diphosphatase